jgi:hypothetical protein
MTEYNGKAYEICQRTEVKLNMCVEIMFFKAVSEGEVENVMQ